MTTMMALTRSVMSRNTLFHHEVGCPLQTWPSGQQRLSRPEQAGDVDDLGDHDVDDQVGRNDGDQVGHDGDDDPVLTPTCERPSSSSSESSRSSLSGPEDPSKERRFSSCFIFSKIFFVAICWTKILKDIFSIILCNFLSKDFQYVIIIHSSINLKLRVCYQTL